MKMTVSEIAELAGCSKSIVNIRIRQIMPEASAGRGGKTMLDKEQTERLLPTLPITNRDLILELRKTDGTNEVRSSASSDISMVVQAIDKMQERQEAFMLKIVEMIRPGSTQPAQIEIEAPAQIEAPGMSSRNRVTKILRSHCQYNRIPYQDAWNQLYASHMYRTGMNFKLRAKNRGLKPLDLFDIEGETRVLLSIAIEMWGE